MPSRFERHASQLGIMTTRILCLQVFGNEYKKEIDCIRLGSVESTELVVTHDRTGSIVVWSASSQEKIGELPCNKYGYSTK